MRFGGRDIRISKRAKFMMCAVGITIAAVAILLSVFVRAPSSPIETAAPATAASDS